MLISMFKCVPHIWLFWSNRYDWYGLSSLTLPLEGFKWRSSCINLGFFNRKHVWLSYLQLWLNTDGGHCARSLNCKFPFPVICNIHAPIILDSVTYNYYSWYHFLNTENSLEQTLEIRIQHTNSSFQNTNSSFQKTNSSFRNANSSFQNTNSSF